MSYDNGLLDGLDAEFTLVERKKNAPNRRDTDYLYILIGQTMPTRVPMTVFLSAKAMADMDTEFGDYVAYGYDKNRGVMMLAKSERGYKVAKYRNRSVDIGKIQFSIDPDSPILKHSNGERVELSIANTLVYGDRLFIDITREQ